MSDAILIVESRPDPAASPADYHRWYDEVHLPEMLGLPGVSSARRYAALDGESFIAIYELDTDIETVRANLNEALTSGAMSRPVGVLLDPPPTTRYYERHG